MFQKRISELTKTDIDRILEEAVQEGPEVEFKETLPAKEGNDQWLNGGDRIGDRARNEIIEEVIAFANAYGGTLLIGISESQDKPSRASSVVPIPRCTELADRLRLQCRDCIEPQLPLIEVSGVPYNQDGSGVVVIRVPASRMAPHRHTITKESYFRRNDRSEKMAMREIQDLTLNIQRGLAAIEQTFEQRKQSFRSRFHNFQAGSPYAAGIRATLQPLVPVYIDRIHKIETAKPPLIRLTGIINKGRYDLALPISFSQWSPVLRGSRTESDDGDFRGRREVFNDGLLEYEILLKTRQEQEFRLYPGWFMALIGNAICAAERFRDTAGTPHIEYGLEIEILNSGSPLPIGQYGGNFGRFLGPMPEGHHVFPRYSINQRDEFQQLAQIIERDFWNLCGHDWDEKDLVMVDFEQAFTNVGLTKK